MVPIWLAAIVMIPMLAMTHLIAKYWLPTDRFPPGPLGVCFRYFLGWTVLLAILTLAGWLLHIVDYALAAFFT